MLIYLEIAMSKTIDHGIETLTREFIHILSQFLFLSLSLDNDAMATLRCVKLFSLIFILKYFQTGGLLV